MCNLHLCEKCGELHFCEKCGEELVKLPFSSEPEGDRPDYFCGGCNTRFGTRKSGSYIISEPCNTAAVVQENKELRITIKQMLKIQKEFSQN